MESGLLIGYKKVGRVVVQWSGETTSPVYSLVPNLARQDLGQAPPSTIALERVLRITSWCCIPSGSISCKALLLSIMIVVIS